MKYIIYVKKKMNKEKDNYMLYLHAIFKKVDESLFQEEYEQSEKDKQIQEKDEHSEKKDKQNLQK